MQPDNLHTMNISFIQSGEKVGLQIFEGWDQWAKSVAFKDVSLLGVEVHSHTDYGLYQMTS